MSDDLVISQPGNLAPVRVPVTSVQASWELSASGGFSGFVRQDDLRAVGLGGDIKGYWLQYPTSAGPWGGVVTGQPSSNGVVEIAAEGFLGLVRGRVITNAVVAASGSAGGLARRALALAGAGNPTFLRVGVIDEGGGPVAVELVGDVGNDVLPQIADAGDVEWRIDAERVFTLARRLGTDRSATVRLVEDRQIVGARITDDLESDAFGTVYRVQGELSRALDRMTGESAPHWEPRGSGGVVGPGWGGLPEGIPVGAAASHLGYRSSAGESWRARRQTYGVELPGVAAAPGSNAAPAPWVGLPVGMGANNPAVAGRRHVPPPTVPCELTLANVDGCFRWFDLGDTVRVELGGNGTTGRFRARVKALDVASQALTVSGDLMRDA